MNKTITALWRFLGILVLFSSTLFAQPSRIELQTLYSSVLGTQKNFNIFLPPGYDAETDRYPVVYLFRGLEREWANPTEDASRRGNIKTVADVLFEAGKIGKTILVMPGLSAPATDLDFTYVLNELIPYVDAHFRTIPTRWCRGMDGFSYGGLSVMQLLRKKPEAFASAGAYDGSYFLLNPSDYTNAPESFWESLRRMKFLVHAAVLGPNNYEISQQLVTLFASHGVQNSFTPLALAPRAEHNWFYADLHMTQSLPLHWQKLLNDSPSFALTLRTPIPGSRLSGSVPIRWSPGIPSDSAKTFLHFCTDGGRTWTQLASLAGRDTSTLWNTLLLPDGALYKLRAMVAGDTSLGTAQTAGWLTIDNPGNGAPGAVLFTPAPRETLSGSQQVTWYAADPEGDSVHVWLDVSDDEGTTWLPLATDITNTGTFAWNTQSSANAERAWLRIRVSDGTAGSQSTAGPFKISNRRGMFADTLLHHVLGNGSGTIALQVTDPLALTGHRYRLTFDDTGTGGKSYSVLDLTGARTVVERARTLDGKSEGPPFDGLRLVIADVPTPAPDNERTGWSGGKSTLEWQVSLPTISLGTTTLHGVASPCDYQIRIADRVVDTSSTFLEAAPVQMRFSVWNQTAGHAVDVVYLDLDGNSALSRFDDLFILEQDSSGQPYLTWEITFTGTENAILPVPGDIFTIAILKPFTHNDVFEFDALPGAVLAVGIPEVPAPFSLAQNYPNPFNPSTSIQYTLPVQSRVRLTVFTLLGQRVAELVSAEQPAGQYRIAWTPALASGIYIYRLEAVGVFNAARRYVETRKMLYLK